jgi:hypothetical protein
VRGRHRVTGTLLLLMAMAAPATAQTERVRVFLDCQTHGCDRQEFRTEIRFVDWVNESTAADVHVILTAQSTGAGVQYVFDFIGAGPFEGDDRRLVASVLDTDTRDEVLASQVRTFKAGLVGYVARRGYLDALEIRAAERREPGGPARPRVPSDDPWNLWVFTIGLSGEAEGEEQQRSYEVGGRLSANRTTPEWKIDIDFDGDYVYEEFELSEGTFIERSEDWLVDALVVRSLTPHWSAGALVEVSSSTELNRRIGGRIAGALEWDLYPYAEANRRQLIVHYQLGVSRLRYDERTLFGRIQETLFDHRLAAVYDTRQPWGSIFFSAAWSNYLDDWSRYRIATSLGTSFRLVRGLELEIEGGYDVIHDQLYLSAEELSDEEILVQRRQLATGYEYELDIGLSYRFGSIYNNVVNNRFPWSVIEGWD